MSHLMIHVGLQRGVENKSRMGLEAAIGMRWHLQLEPGFLKMLKCAWFDERDHFEFFPLEAVKEKRRGFVAASGLPRKRLLPEHPSFGHLVDLLAEDLGRSLADEYCRCQLRHVSRRQVRHRLNSRPFRRSTTTLSAVSGWPSSQNESSVTTIGPCNR